MQARRYAARVWPHRIGRNRAPGLLVVLLSHIYATWVISKCVGAGTSLINEFLLLPNSNPF